MLEILSMLSRRLTATCERPPEEDVCDTRMYAMGHRAAHDLREVR